MKIPHQNCEHELQEEDAQFYIRGRFFKGLVCKTCNALYQHPEDPFLGSVPYSESDIKKNHE